MAEADLDPEGAPYFYLCGVTPVYAENLHLPFRFCPGGRVVYEDANVCIQIEDAEQIDILPLPDAVLNSERYGERFTTCRNFQFGWRAFSEPLKW